MSRERRRRRNRFRAGDILTPPPASETARDEPQPHSSPGHDGFVPGSLEVKQLSDFVAGSAFRGLLQRGAVLLHGKRAFADRTLEILCREQKSSLRLKRPAVDWTVEEVLAISPRPRRPTIVLVDRPRRHAQIVQLLEQRATARTPSFGAWILGFMSEFALSELALFDAIIAFDMSTEELGRLRSAAVLSAEDEARLGSQDCAFLYVASRPRAGWRYALPEPNPAILTMGISASPGETYPMGRETSTRATAGSIETSRLHFERG